MHSLRFIVSGGAPLPTEVHERLQQHLGRQYCNTMAVTKLYWFPPTRCLRGRPNESGTCGIPPADTVTIVDKSGDRLAVGQKGEILLRGPTVMSGYLEDPELNRAAFVDGWFRTGDIGSLDEDGFLTLHGREKELINRGAEKSRRSKLKEH